jgi:ribosomal protein S18 acetylase RimI-like enzyme
MVAEIGIWFPTSEHPYYVITNMAIKPALRWQWIGKNVLKEIVNLHRSPLTDKWKAYVNWNNLKAKSFFEHNEWICVSTPPDNDKMFLMEYNKK